MLTADLNTGACVIALYATKQQAPFYCPECGGAVILKKGNIKTHHFAHIPPTVCEYAGGETEAHLGAKIAIYEALKARPCVSKCQMERGLKTVRPDISCYIGNVPVAIEVQRSNLSLDVVRRRFAEYTRMGIALLWVLLDAPPVLTSIGRDDTVRLKDWQRYLKGMYYNKLYYFKAGSTLSVFSFEAWESERSTGWDGESVTGYIDVRLKNTWCALHKGDVDIENGEPYKRKSWKDFQPAYLWRLQDAA